MRKRGANEGTIAKRADGRWVAAVTLPNGKRKYLYAPTRAEVAVRLTAAQAATQAGDPPIQDERLTLKDWLDHWLENTIRPNKRASTYRYYEHTVRLHINPELGRIRLTQLTPEHVEAWLKQKAKDGRVRPARDKNPGLSAQSVQHLRAILRAALGVALKRGKIRRNVATLADGPSVKRYKAPTISPDDARAIIQAVQGDRLEALFITAIASGLRQGEALALRWSDVHLAKGEVTDEAIDSLDQPRVDVTATLQRTGGQFERVDPKTERSRRTIPIPPLVVDALRAHQDRQAFERKTAGNLWYEGDGLCFTRPTGEPIHGSTVNHQLQALLRRADLPVIRFHDLRHGCAALLVALGVHPRTVMEQLGHSQISVTMNYYAGVVPALQREAADQLGALLASK
ncbi:MAG: site-specific integrase [Chloroflexi bacterium]|nr:site-specific integrase [Chloroflexota bacterium]